MVFSTHLILRCSFIDSYQYHQENGVIFYRYVGSFPTRAQEALNEFFLNQQLPPSSLSSSHPSLPLHAPFHPSSPTCVTLLCDSPLIPPSLSPPTHTHSFTVGSPPFPPPSPLYLLPPPPKPSLRLSPAVAVVTVCSAHQAPAVPKQTVNSLITHPFIPLSIHARALYACACCLHLSVRSSPP